MLLILYSKPGCHLCDRLEAAIAPHLDRLRGRHPGLRLEHRDITGQQAWSALYRYRIPVLTLDDRVLLEGNPTMEQVAAAFRDL